MEENIKRALGIGDKPVVSEADSFVRAIKAATEAQIREKQPPPTTRVRVRTPNLIYAPHEVRAAAEAAEAQKIEAKAAKTAEKAALKAQKVEERRKARDEKRESAKRKRSGDDVGELPVAKRQKVPVQCRDCGLQRKSGMRNWVQCDVCESHWICSAEIGLVNSLSGCKELKVH